MSKYRSPLSLVVLSATMISLSLKDTRHAGQSIRYIGLSLRVDDEANPDGGGTEQQVKTDPPEANANSNVITSVAGGGEQMQAQTSETAQVGGTEIDSSDNKVNDGSDAGLGKPAISEPAASDQAPQA